MPVRLSLYHRVRDDDEAAGHLGVSAYGIASSAHLLVRIADSGVGSQAMMRGRYGRIRPAINGIFAYRI